MAWLLDRWFGRPFNFGDIRRVIGFFAAAAIATAVSAVGGALTMTTFHASAPFFDVWRTWFLSDAVGIVVVAPLLIALSQLKRELPTRAELIEWGGVLALTVLTSFYALSAPTGSWLSFDPDAIVFPLLLWLAIRNQLFAIAGALAVSLVDDRSNHVRHRPFWRCEPLDRGACAWCATADDRRDGFHARSYGRCLLSARRRNKGSVKARSGFAWLS